MVSTTRRVLVIGLLIVLWTGACRRAPEPIPTAAPSDTPTASVPPSTLTPTTRASSTPTQALTSSPIPLGGGEVYPAPAQPTVTLTGGYPPPVSLPTAYPAPSTPFPSSASPYPPPTAVTPQSLTATPFLTPGGAAPTPLPTTRPEYPPPTGATPTLITPGVISPTPPIPATQAGVPTLAPTQGLVRTRLQATDPRTFEIISGQYQLVEFFAFWSTISKSMAPVVYSLEDRYQDQIRFVYLDIDDPANSLFRSLIGSRLPPLFFLLDGQGNVVKEWVGYVSAEEFESVFASLNLPVTP